MLKVESIDSREPIELGRIMRGAEVELGREPAAQGIPIGNDSVSRSHAKISSIGNYWTFEDLGSTNGSWVNGQQVNPGAVKFLRSGDTLQLANAVLQVTELSADGQSIVTRSGHLPQRSLIVLLGDHLVGEYPVPEYGRALVIGGVGADLQVEGMMLNNPSLVVERKGMFTTASSSSTEIGAFIEGVRIDQPVTLKDGALITVARYRVLFNEPQLAGVVDSLTPDVNDWSAVTRRGGPESGHSRDDYGGGFLNKPSQGALFGKPIHDSDGDEEDERGPQDTVRMDPMLAVKTFGRDHHPSMRASVSSGGFSFDSLEERIVLVVGVALVIALLVLSGIWLFG